jgi:RNA-directed DNA polymerase
MKRRRWCLFRHVVATSTFRKAERKIWQAVWRWAKRRHPTELAGWVIRKYWHSVGRRKWWFAAYTGKKTADGKPIWLQLVNPADTKIRRHRKIREDANPSIPTGVLILKTAWSLKSRHPSTTDTQ